MASKKKKKTAAKPKVAKKKKLPKGKSAPKKVKKSKPKRDTKTGRFLSKPKVKKKKSRPKAKPKKKAPALPVIKPKVKPSRKRVRRRQDITHIRVGDFEDYVTATHLSTDAQHEHFKNFSHLTRSDINATLDSQTATLTKVFSAAIDGHLSKMGIEYEDLRIFSYGVLFRPDGAELTQSLVSEIAIILQGFRPQIVLAEETDGQNAIMINFGWDTRRLDAIQVHDRLDAYSAKLQEVFMLLYSELGTDIDWSVWWDTDEMMY